MTIFICKTDYSKSVKQEVNDTVILSSLVFPESSLFDTTGESETANQAVHRGQAQRGSSSRRQGPGSNRGHQPVWSKNQRRLDRSVRQRKRR